MAVMDIREIREPTQDSQTTVKLYPHYLITHRSTGDRVYQSTTAGSPMEPHIRSASGLLPLQSHYCVTTEYELFSIM